MPQINTVPNQRTITIHRERIAENFLGIKNENWMNASRLLGAHALRLYLYLASNANNFELALSPSAIERDLGMSRSTYHDQFRKLVNSGFLVPSANGSRYDFYELPQTSLAHSQQNETSAVLNFEEMPTLDTPILSVVEGVMAEDTEINNKNTENNPTNIWMPKEKVILAEKLIEEGKMRPPSRAEWIF